MLAMSALVIGALAAWALPFLAFAFLLLAAIVLGGVVVALSVGMTVEILMSGIVLLVAGQVGYALGLIARALIGGLRQRVSPDHGRSPTVEERPFWPKRWTRTF